MLYQILEQNEADNNAVINNRHFDILVYILI